MKKYLWKECVMNCERKTFYCIDCTIDCGSSKLKLEGYMFKKLVIDCKNDDFDMLGGLKKCDRCFLKRYCSRVADKFFGVLSFFIILLLFTPFTFIFI